MGNERLPLRTTDRINELRTRAEHVEQERDALRRQMTEARNLARMLAENGHETVNVGVQRMAQQIVAALSPEPQDPQKPCERCGGSGELLDPCPACHGSGVAEGQGADDG